MQVNTEEQMMDIQVDKIKSEIVQRASELIVTKTSSVLYIKWYRVKTRIISFFARLHHNFSKHEFYMKSMGAFVLFIQSRYPDYQIVDFSTYLPMQDEKFIVSLYKDVLKREVDPMSFESMLSALISSPDSKIDIGYDLNISREASLKKVYIRGVYFKKLMLDLKRSFARWLSKPLSLFSRIKNRVYRMIRRNQQ